jgi:dihydrofolate reductase
MRKLIVSEFVTLDGVMEAPGGEPTHPHTGWVTWFPGEEHFRYKLEEIREAETHLLGRVTYESFAGAWPERDDEYAAKINPMPKVVVSNTLKNPAWQNTTVISGDVIGGVRALKQGEGGPILVAGSATLVHTLLENDLVDELRLMVFPVSIGAGLRVFPDAHKKAFWQLADFKTWDNGVRLEVYRPEASSR